MPKAILDTNVLISHWRKQRSKLSGRPVKKEDCAAWARELIDFRRSGAIVEPVYIEFICWARTKDELELLEEFLRYFDRVDRGRVLPEDWERAKDYARKLGWLKLERQLGDCLIRAIADRLRADVITADRGFPKKGG